jgi:hypothetical protein
MTTCATSLGWEITTTCEAPLTSVTVAPGAEAGKVVPKPAGLSFEQAAAIPVAATTALRGIWDVGQVRAGHRVLRRRSGYDQADTSSTWSAC